MRTKIQGIPYTTFNIDANRFNPEIDRQTGYVTKTILCMPIKNILGETIGVMQMINKRIGVFTAEDEMILSSFCSQGKNESN